MLNACRLNTAMLSSPLSILLVLYFLSNSSTAQSTKTSLGNDYENVKGLQGSYKIHSTPKSWHDAKQACADEDAVMFYPKNREEVNAAILFWERNHTAPPDTWIFVGMSDIETEGVYETIDGKPISEVFNSWSPHQPDNWGDEDCVQLGFMGVINDIKCTAEFGFICAKKLSGEQNNSATIQQSGSVAQKNETSIRKDYERLRGLQGVYKFHTTSMIWSDAKQACADEDASLFYPKNKKEVDTVISFWKRYQNDTDPDWTWLYVGISDIATEGTFETIDGKSISEVYNNWRFRQPDNYGNEDCVMLNQLGFLNDIKCEAKYVFICQKKPSQEGKNSCNTQQSDLDYTFDEDIGKCYKLHTTPLNWTEAYTVCRHEQSHLAVISNQLEAEYLANLTESTPNPRVKEDYQRGVYHVGFHNQFNEGWQTVKGARMDVDMDVWWDNYKPADDRAQCGSMFYTGRLVNTDCAMKSFFICEHDIDSEPRKCSFDN